MFVDTPLVSNNNLTLLRCRYMCVGTLVHISRHQGKTSNNNNKRRQLWIRCLLYRVCFYWVFTSDFRFYDYYHINCSHPALSLVFYSISLLLLSYHSMSTSCLISLVLYLPDYMPMLRHCFQCMIMIRFYRYTCAYLCTLSGFRITTRLGSSI